MEGEGKPHLMGMVALPCGKIDYSFFVLLPIVTSFLFLLLFIFSNCLANDSTNHGFARNEVPKCLLLCLRKDYAVPF